MTTYMFTAWSALHPHCSTEVEIPHPQVTYFLHNTYNRTSGRANVAIQGAVISNSSNVSLKLEMFLNSLQAKLVKLSRLQQILNEEENKTLVSASKQPFYSYVLGWENWCQSRRDMCYSFNTLLLSQCKLKWTVLLGHVPTKNVTTLTVVYLAGWNNRSGNVYLLNKVMLWGVVAQLSSTSLLVMKWLSSAMWALHPTEKRTAWKWVQHDCIRIRFTEMWPAYSLVL